MEDMKRLDPGRTTTTMSVEAVEEPKKGIGAWFRRMLVSGLLFGLPVMFTLFVVVTVWSWLDQPLRRLFRNPEKYPSDFAGCEISRAVASWNVAHIPYVEYLDTPGVGFIGTLLIFMAVGIVVRSYLGGKLARRIELIMDRIPLVRTVYGAVKGFGEAFLGGHKGFQKAVLVQFPVRGSWLIGFVTGKIPAAEFDNMLRKVPEDVAACREDRLRVLVPLTPPTTSLLMIVRRSEVVDLAMSVEDAVKLVMSGGIMLPPHQDLPPGKAAERPASG
ncbi:MAG: DUF502 domain-containing protein [Planctomycetota bacterium]|nr:DUF502 domain-containing protein [Planctomycetota bacterium]